MKSITVRIEWDGLGDFKFDATDIREALKGFAFMKFWDREEEATVTVTEIPSCGVDAVKMFDADWIPWIPEVTHLKDDLRKWLLERIQLAMDSAYQRGFDDGNDYAFPDEPKSERVPAVTVGMTTPGPITSGYVRVDAMPPAMDYPDPEIEKASGTEIGMESNDALFAEKEANEIARQNSLPLNGYEPRRKPPAWMSDGEIHLADTGRPLPDGKKEDGK